MFLTQRRIERLYYSKCTYVLCKSARFSCQILMKVESSPQIYRKTLKYQGSWKPVQWEPSCSMWAERHETNGRFFAILRTSLKIVSRPMPVYDYDAGSFAWPSSLRIRGYYKRGTRIIVKLTIGELVMRQEWGRSGSGSCLRRAVD